MPLIPFIKHTDGTPTEYINRMPNVGEYLYDADTETLYEFTENEILLINGAVLYELKSLHRKTKNKKGTLLMTQDEVMDLQPFAVQKGQKFKIDNRLIEVVEVFFEKNAKRKKSKRGLCVTFTTHSKTPAIDTWMLKNFLTHAEGYA